MNEISCYISGPITLGDRDDNIRQAIIAANILRHNNIHFYCPHALYPLEQNKPWSHSEWLNEDLYWLGKCDCVLRLPGESKGADIEVMEAVKLGIPVFTEIEEVITYANI